ncbi:MAG: flagellar basal body protein [Devosia sp.]
MNIAKMPLLDALAEKMRWHQSRQNVLAENIANAQTPGFVSKDLAAFSLDDNARAPLSMASVSYSAESPSHIAISSFSDAGGFGVDNAGGYETTPDSNAVTLEDQMMKVTSNELDYQTVTTLYTRSMRLIRTALGKAA